MLIWGLIAISFSVAFLVLRNSGELYSMWREGRLSWKEVQYMLDEEGELGDTLSFICCVCMPVCVWLYIRYMMGETALELLNRL